MEEIRRYAEMKNSGLEWIGEIPEHWQYTYIKYTATLAGRIGWQGLTSAEYCDEGAWLITGVNFNNGSINWESCVHVPMSRWKEATQVQIREGDLLITKDGTVGKIAIATNLPGAVSLNSGVMVIRIFSPAIQKSFLYWLLQSDVFWHWFNLINAGNSTIIHLYQADFYNFCFSIPPLPEQRSIASYLDEKCTAIDDIITSTRDTIEDYKKLKASTIYEAVTKGLNPDAKMKDSGVEWIGEIPEVWSTIKFKRVHLLVNVGASIDKDYWTSDSEDRTFYTAGLIPITTSFRLFPEWKYTSDKDLLLARNGTPYVYLPSVGSIYSDHIIRASIVVSFDRKYVRYALQQSIANEIVDVVSIATWSITIWDQQILPFPPLSEQQSIATYLDDRCSQIDGLISEKEALIKDLEDYKKSLIYECVTGKRKVVPE